jgi:hypothetical protein
VEWEDLAGRWRGAWGPVSLAKVVSVAVVAGLLAWWSSTGERWVPLLDSANLAFHEAGHLIYGVFGQTLGLYGGTLGQLTFPVVCAAIFAFRREPASFAMCVIWFGQNLCNIARYAADARAQELPLVGGGEHDWNNILSRWGALDADLRVGRTFHGIGIAAMMIAAGWLGFLWYRDRTRGQVGRASPAGLG